MANPELLSIKDIARKLQVAESNIRYYRDKFLDFLPYVGEGRKKRYKAQALEVFAYIIQAYKQDKSAKQIERELTQRFPRNLQVEEGVGYQPKSELQQKSYANAQADHALLQSQARVMEQLAEILSDSKHQTREISQISGEQNRLKKALILLSKDYKKFRYSLQGENQAGLRDLIGEHKKEQEALRAEMEKLQERQADLEKRLEEKVARLEKELEKNQFWTKRLLMQKNTGGDQDVNSGNE